MTLDRKDIEIMAPAGSYESLTGAIQGGADSVYFGVGELNMRSASSANFTLDDLRRIVEICRKHGLKTYLTVNTVLYDDDLPAMRAILDRARAEGVDAVIAADQAAIFYARSIGLEVHLSTQLNVSNIETVAFYAGYADVMVLARELNLKQVREIYDRIAARDIRGPRGERVKIEMFAHGALCMAISGKCYLSLHDSLRSANRGACLQICRRAYRVTDAETGTELDVENPYVMSPKDLCTIDFLDEVVAAGVRVLKIEGRARSGEYVRRVCECYDEAMRAVADGTFSDEKVAGWKERLGEVFNRGFWGGYYLGQRLGEWNRAYGSSATKKKIYVGRVTNYFKNIEVAEIMVEAAPLAVGDELLILGETSGVVEFTADELRLEVDPVERVLQGSVCSVAVPDRVRRGDKLYKYENA
ncbi:MAG: U32 family peptidase [Rikenellaceae bacterium]|jgi:putative protease|nr:U32 family peptidase [Rikenellaceae bacterium]